MEPVEVLPIVALLAIVTVEFGGHALLKFVTTDHDRLGELRERFFRAGHAHAGVLLVLTLAYFLYLPRARYSDGLEWTFGTVLLGGVLAQSGGFFVHLGIGRAGARSFGTTLTRIGALAIAVALVALAAGLIREL
ncbi:hypothetical protein DZF91_21495 [Actinomadura logoneensis]|uniref:Integral membrane protein n=1 Tax=Actinomadura logoneensis TaxID=2293572 RepID=A0A372JJY4_9ACTN|nr:hypothetical protein [Actinomadura logoneensis]RFU39618.1 hypothetical protein DZF91_21495 [Actinomadura logoneensis]